jgi:hypothetical protein
MPRFCVIMAVLLSGSVALPGLADEPVKVKPPQQNTLACENGRFVLGQLSEFRRDNFLLDTKTGRVWNVVVDKSAEDGTEVIVLQPVPFVGSGGKWHVASQ